jgi:hypothetical protein
MPDPDTHRLCRRCHKWKPNDEVGFARRTSLFQPRNVILRAKQIAGIPDGLEAICFVCQASRRRKKIALYVGFALLVIAVLLRARIVEGHW